MNVRTHRFVFLLNATVAGVVFQTQADWFAYVELGDGPVAKFELPWWVQLPICAVAGIAVGLTSLIGIRGIMPLRLLRFRPGPPAPGDSPCATSRF